MAEKPFAHLNVPNIREPYLSLEEVRRLVKPFYLSGPEEAPFRKALTGIYHDIDLAMVERLLSFFDWRPKVAGTRFAIIKNLSGAEELIGKLLLRSDVCYAGEAYCLALARFNTPAGRQTLNTYLDCYLRRPDLCYDQKAALDALSYLDAQNGTHDTVAFETLWHDFMADKPNRSWNREQSAQRVAQTLKAYTRCARGLDPTRLSVERGDITSQKVDAIVNAANSSLLGGGGVDGAIHRAAGPGLVEECRAIVARQGECPPGQAVITSGCRLPARFVIHTVGPMWRGGQDGEPERLADCYRNCLQLAVDHDLDSLAFPCISTGAYGYPAEAAAEVAVRTVRAFVARQRRLSEVRFVVFSDRDQHLYQSRLES
jgi:O-acetyl-ADP-ribose deacetylase (regulator of RNase III)